MAMKIDNQNEDTHYVRESGSNDRSDYSLAKAFKNAGAGIAYAMKTQRNVRIDLVFAVIAIALGFILKISVTQWAVVCLCIGSVIGMECMNTAIESVVDLVSPEYHILAKRAKDCAAGAVYLDAIASAAVGIIIFVPRILLMIGLA